MNSSIDDLSIPVPLSTSPVNAISRVRRRRTVSTNTHTHVHTLSFSLWNNDFYEKRKRKEQQTKIRRTILLSDWIRTQRQFHFVSPLENSIPAVTKQTDKLEFVRIMFPLFFLFSSEYNSSSFLGVRGGRIVSSVTPVHLCDLKLLPSLDREFFLRSSVGATLNTRVRKIGNLFLERR